MSCRHPGEDGEGGRSKRRSGALNTIAWIQLLTIVVLGTVAQVSLKAALDDDGTRGGGGASLRALLCSALLWTWVVCYLASTLLWLWALRVVPLSQAFPILGLQFALVPLASQRLLKERLLRGQWLGVAIIVVGVALVGWA